MLERRTGFTQKLGPIGHIYVMAVAVTAFVFFNSPTVDYAIRYVGVMFGVIQPRNVGFSLQWYVDRYIIVILLLSVVGATPIVKNLWRKLQGRLPETAYAVCANLLALGLLCICAMYVMTSTYNPFIYFQF